MKFYFLGSYKMSLVHEGPCALVRALKTAKSGGGEKFIYTLLK